MFNLFRRAKAAPPKAPSLDGIDLHLKDISGAVELIEDYPRIHWPIVREAMKPFAAHPAASQIWTELAAQWLDILQSHLGKPYDLYESNHLLLLSPAERGVAARFLKLGDAAYERIEGLIGRQAAESGGKHVVIVLKSESAYYEYVSWFVPKDGRERAKSAGKHISRGYHHTVISARSKTNERTLVHELGHEMISGRQIPLWLNEGLAQYTEDMVPGYRPPLIDHRGVRLQRRYWSWFGMDHFWSGRSFSTVSSQRLSYQLSEILFRNLANHRWRSRKLPEFLSNADYKDAGMAACQRCFGCSLSELVSEFLGDGDWVPKAGDAAALKPNVSPEPGKRSD